MLGCVYLILAALLGREITHNFLPEQRMREKGITPLCLLAGLFPFFRFLHTRKNE